MLSPRSWRLTDFALRHELLLAEVGWGRMPIAWVERDLQQKRLIRIVPDVWRERVPSVELRVVYRSEAPPGPAGSWLARELIVGGRAWEEGLSPLE